MNTRMYPPIDEEAVSAPYRPAGPVTRQMPRSPAPTTLPPRFYEHAVLVAAGVHASWLWFCACDKVHEQGGHRFLTMTVVRQLMDFEGLGVKAKRVVQDLREASAELQERLSDVARGLHRPDDMRHHLGLAARIRIDAGLFAQTKSGILIQLDALDDRRP